jgi:hypothetical protein
MTGPEDQETRPISVAELLARNGTIGAPPLGGRRRRRRGNADAVTVAELTGEIPVVNTGEIPVARHDDRQAEEPTHAPDLAPTNGTAGPVAEPLTAERPHYDEPAEHPDDHEHDYPDYEDDLDDYMDSIRGPRSAGVRAEQMRPDPVDDEDDIGAVALEEHPGARTDEHDDLPSYLRTEHAPLFGGQTVADDLARRSSGASEDLLTEAPIAEDEAAVAAQPLTTIEKALRGGWIVLQSIIAVAFGAGLFLGFDELWKWNNIVALVLSVLVILGLVVAVRIVRKTEDIASTLIAVAVGALVTLGPLALLQSN